MFWNHLLYHLQVNCCFIAVLQLQLDKILTFDNARDNAIGRISVCVRARDKVCATDLDKLWKDLDEIFSVNSNKKHNWCWQTPATLLEGTPFSGVVKDMGGKIGDFRAIFDGNHRLSWKRCDIRRWLLWNVNRKSWVPDWMISFSVTLSDL